MILVVGATGTNGREVVARLSRAGQAVRALVRDPARADGLRLPGVDLVRGDLDDPASLDAALRGVTRAFVVTAVDPGAVRRFAAFFEAAHRAGGPHVVKFSGMGAGGPAEILRQHGDSDRLLAESGLPYTILRPNSFYQDLLWSAGSIRERGEFYLPLRDARQSLVDVRDIADAAVAVLTGNGHAGKVYDLTGPAALSFAEVADTLSAVIGRPVRYVDVPPEAARQAMEGAGMPAWNAAAVAELYGYFADGKAAAVTGDIERLTGRPATSFAQFARDHAAAFA